MVKQKIKGTVLIEKLDAKTYEVKETLPLAENDFNISTLIYYYMNDSSMSLPPQRGITTGSDKYWWIYWSQSEIKQSYLNSNIPTESLNSELIGSYVACNLGSPFLTTKSLPTEKDYLTFIADIIPGSTTRTIRSLALCHKSTTGQLIGLPNYNIPFTNINLTTPCIQDNLTVIRVTYRLYYDDPIRNTNNSEFSDAPYYYFIDSLKQISNGTLTGNTVKTLYSANVYLTSSFYNPDNIDNYKYTLFNNNNEGKIFSDSSYSQTISKTWYHDNLTFQISDPLTSVTTMGCFFRTINIFGGNIGNFELVKFVYGSGGGYNSCNIGYPYMYKTILPNTTTPIKNVFKQTALANTPFQDLSTIGNMTGTIAIDASTWNTQPLPKIVKLNITGSGDNTTATYKYEVGTFSGGFMENTFSPRSVIFPQDGYFNDDISYHRKNVQDNNILEQVTSGGTVIRSPDNTKYFVVVNCQRNKDSISYYNIETGNKYILNSTTTPSLPVTATSDMAVSNGYTFVTCSNTGLWKISPDFTTVTHITSIGGTIDSTKAYQIDVKENGDLWVLFEGGLAKGVTIDNGLNWNWSVYDTTTSPVFSATGITNANWSNVTAMCVDPVHANDRILFVLGSASSTNNNAAGFIWWEGLTGTTTIMTNGVPYPSFSLNNNLQRSDILRCANGIWFTSTVSETDGGVPASATIYKTSYSNTTWTTNATTGYDGRIIPAKINNIKSVFIGSIGSMNSNSNRYAAIVVKETSLSSLPSTINISMSQKEFSILNGSSATVNNYSANIVIHNASTPVLYLENSNMIICFCPLSKLFYFLPLIPPTTATNYNDYKGAFWKEYGWNGSNWVLGNTNSKTCHSSFDTFFDGLTIRFTNGLTGTSFLNTEKFIFVVGNGIMKDNATQLDLKISISPWETEVITDLYHPINGQITTVPSTIYGKRVDELVCFSPKLPSTTNEKLSMIATKGSIRQLASVYSEYISSEEIPANTEFTLKFKVNSTHVTINSNNVIVTTLGFTTNGSSNIITIYHNTSNGNLEIKDGEFSGSVLGSIPRNLLSINKEFVITRLKNNLIVFMYDNIIYAAKLSSAKFYIDCQNDNTGSSIFLGYSDIKLSYTDFRRMALFGNQTTQTSKFNDKYMHIYVNNFLSNLKCTINNIPQTILFTPSYASVLASNQVRYETGSGYIVFSEMPTITSSISGATTLPALYPIISGGVITSIIIEKNGSGYTSTPTLTISAPTSGTTATATVTLDSSNSINDLVTITNAGSGYTPGIYPLIITEGGGTGATGNVYISTTGVVVAVDITNGGSNYTSTPTLSFTGAGTPTTNAVLTAAIGKRIASITVTNGGSEYITDANTSISANTIAMYYP